MSASAIWTHSTARLGSVIRFSDGTPKPPARFKRKLRDWEDRNGSGRLAAVNDPYRIGSPGTFTLHLGDFGSQGVIVMRVNKVYTTDSPLTFVIADQPTPGAALCLTEFGGKTELQHIARDRADATAWLERNRYSNARIEIVPEPASASALVDA